MQAKRMARFYSLDVDRGAVRSGRSCCIKHLVADAWFVHNVFDIGKLGVTLFFLISGFVIPFSLDRDASIKSFAVKRFFRPDHGYRHTRFSTFYSDVARSRFTAFLRTSATSAIRRTSYTRSSCVSFPIALTHQVRLS